jgi:hypothetical protein
MVSSVTGYVHKLPDICTEVHTKKYSVQEVTCPIGRGTYTSEAGYLSSIEVFRTSTAIVVMIECEGKKN